MRPLEQAKELKKRTRRALAQMRRFDREGLDESEVLFRLDAVSGILIIALQDIEGVIEAWSDDTA